MLKQRGRPRKAGQSLSDMQSLNQRENSISATPCSSRRRGRPPRIKKNENSAGQSETCKGTVDNDPEAGTSFVRDTETAIGQSIAENAEEQVVASVQDVRDEPVMEEGVFPEYDAFYELDAEIELFVNTRLSHILDLYATKSDISNVFEETSIKTEPVGDDADSRFQDPESSASESTNDGGVIVSFDENNFKIFPYAISADHSLANEASVEEVSVKQEPLDDFSEEITRIRFKTEPKFEDEERSPKTSRDLTYEAYTGGIDVKQEPSHDFSEKMTLKKIKTEKKFDDVDKYSATYDNLTNEMRAAIIFADSRNTRVPIMQSEILPSQYTNNTDRTPSHSTSHNQDYSCDNDRDCSFENKVAFVKVKTETETLDKQNKSLILNDHNIRIKRETGNDYEDNTVSKETYVYTVPRNREEEFREIYENTRKRIKIEPDFSDGGENLDTRDEPYTKKEIQSEDSRGRSKKSSLSDCTSYMNTAAMPEFHTETCLSESDISYYFVIDTPVSSALKKEKETLENVNTSKSLLSKRVHVKKEVTNNTEGDITPRETYICSISAKRKIQEKEKQKVIRKKIKSEPVPVVFLEEKHEIDRKRMPNELISIVLPKEKELITRKRMKSESNLAVPQNRKPPLITLSDDDDEIIILSEDEDEFIPFSEDEVECITLSGDDDEFLITLSEDGDKIEEHSRADMELNSISPVASSSSRVSGSFSKSEDHKRTSEKKDFSSEILKDFSTQQKSDNCYENKDNYLIKVKREKLDPTVICLNVKNENDSKTTRDMVWNQTPAFHSEIASSPPDSSCDKKTSRKKYFSTDILNYFSVVSELDRAEIHKTALDYFKKLKTKNSWEKIFNIPKKPKLRITFEKGDILFKKASNSQNEETDNIA